MKASTQPFTLPSFLTLQECLAADLTDEALFWVQSNNSDLVHAPVLPDALEPQSDPHCN